MKEKGVGDKVTIDTGESKNNMTMCYTQPQLIGANAMKKIRNSEDPDIIHTYSYR